MKMLNVPFSMKILLRKQLATLRQVCSLQYFLELGVTTFSNRCFKIYKSVSEVMLF